MGEFSIWHILIILFVILIFFGPSRLPGLGNSLGKAIRGFKEGIKGINDEVNEEKPAQKAHDAIPGQPDETTANKSADSKTKNSV